MLASDHGPLLGGLRIVIVGAGLAGGYAGRLFADQGAEVVHVEGPGSTALAHRSAAAGTPAGAVYRHLLAGTRRLVVDAATPGSLDRLASIVAGCDAVLVDVEGGGKRPSVSVEQLRPWCRGTVLAAISLWGLDAERRAGNEFTLQAAVGGTGSRGRPDTPPLAADGDRGLWHTGAYAAVAVLAAIGTATPDRVREVDVCAYECIVTAWNLYEWIRRVLWDPPRDLPRWTDVPGIERAADGWVGFSLVTPDQWKAYCAMTGAPELADEPGFGQLTGRAASHQRIRAATQPWLDRHTVEEIVARAAASRIPAVPVLPAGRLTELPHFVERGTFVPATDQLPQRPAPPYKIDGRRPCADVPVRDLGPAAGAVWSDRPSAPPPLDPAALAVLDVSAFYAGPYATQVLAMLGADVVHVEAAQRYDGMRNVSTRPRTEDGWWEFSYVYQGAQAGKRALALDLAHADAGRVLPGLVQRYDIVLENFSRDVAPRLGLDRLAEQHPGVILVRSPGFGLDGPWSPMRAFAMTGDQISGLAWRTGWPDDRPVAPRTIGDSFTALHSTFAVLAAARRRAATGRGAFIEVASMEASINLTAEEVVEWSEHGIEMGRVGNRSLTRAPQGVYRAAGEDEWLALSVDDDEAWRGLLDALGAGASPAPTGRAAAWALAQRLEHHDEIDRWIGEWCAGLGAAEAVEGLQRVGVPAERVRRASDLAGDERLASRGYFAPHEHPLAGPLHYAGLPWRVDGRRPVPDGYAPLFGQHTREVLTEVGLDADEIDALFAAGAVGGHPRVESPADPPARAGR